MITRDQLLAAVHRAGAKVSVTQLRRWCDVGLMPTPARRGLGRGRGIVALYPAYAAWQAFVIARALKEKRNLDDAGWVAWALGFPVTGFARDLLLEELEDQERQLKAIVRAAGRERLKDRLIEQGKPKAELASSGIAKVLDPAAIPKFVQMMAEYQLGQIHEHDYSDAEWQHLQEAALATLFPRSPEVLDAEDLPSTEEVKQGLNRLSREAPISKVIKALKHTDDQALSALCAEAQAVASRYAHMTGSPERVISRAGFQSYFTQVMVDPEGPAERERLKQVMGWKTPPHTPVQQFLLRNHQSLWRTA
jgi:predicted RNase H-like nuclease